LKTYRQLIQEALLLIAAATALGFAYTFVTKQGFFSEKKTTFSAAAANLEIISLEKAKELYESQGVLFIDSRHDFEYKMGHIRGAINIALKEIDTHRILLESIPKEKMLIVYCDGAECNSSIELALKLMELKFTNVKVFFGGWQEWKTNNLSIDEE
jgi:rhodanese-related sulfurtransferase